MWPTVFVVLEDFAGFTRSRKYEALFCILTTLLAYFNTRALRIRNEQRYEEALVAAQSSLLLNFTEDDGRDLVAGDFSAAAAAAGGDGRASSRFIDALAADDDEDKEEYEDEFDEKVSLTTTVFRNDGWTGKFFNHFYPPKPTPPPISKSSSKHPCPKPAYVFFKRALGDLGAEETVVRNKEKVYKYDRQVPLIFIGGMPRSGTTLMRAMLDAHPMVRCGEETRVVPRILQMVAQWRKSPKESLRLQEAGLSADVIDAGVSAFILEVVARHGEPAPRLCNKDPFTLKSGGYLASMFPNSKFIFMIRDARATVHSIISRKVTITGFDLTNFRQCIQKWNQAVSTMHNQCSQVLGPTKCLPVHYEQLVLHPRQQMERILDFMNIPWNESVLHHEEMIGKPGGVSLSKVERSSDQVIKPLNLEALTSWYNHVPKDVQKDLAELAPMMAIFGYDPNDPRPNYGQPDPLVRDKTKEILEEAEQWKRKAESLLKGKNRAPFKGEEELINEIHNPPLRPPVDEKEKDGDNVVDENNNNV